MKLPSRIPSKQEIELFELLQNIQLGIWVIVILLLILVAIFIYAIDLHKTKALQTDDSDWSKIVENYYENGKSDEAIQTLKISEIQRPKNATIKWWFGRCYFQQEEWDLAAEKFEECLRLDPYFKKIVKDYMAFIELNNLVEGVSGYIESGGKQS